MTAYDTGAAVLRRLEVLEAAAQFLKDQTNALWAAHFQPAPALFGYRTRNGEEEFLNIGQVSTVRIGRPAAHAPYAIGLLVVLTNGERIELLDWEDRTDASRFRTMCRWQGERPR